MSSPSISVLLTAYNRQDFIRDSIESVLAQRFTNFELLIVDNCSTDKTADIAREYEAKDSRVKVFINERNIGQFPNRNRAATLARGEFIKYHDSDDLMYPHCLSTMIGPMRAEPDAAAGISLSRAFLGGASPMLLTPRLSYQREFLGQGMFMGGPACGIFRRQIFLEHGGFPERGVASDFFFWLSFCAKVNVLTLPGDLFWYRLHAGQEFQDPAVAVEYMQIPEAQWQALASAKCPLTSEERDRARKTVVVRFGRALANDISAGRLRMAFQRYRASRLSLFSIVKHLRPPGRNILSGTPVSVEGDYIVPNWSMYNVTEDAD